MERKMFCFQCEQTAACTGCTGKAGVCGKTADVAQLQDELTGALIGCGTCSGRDTDKAAQVGLTMQEVEGTNIKTPVPCKLLIHATVAQTMDADDHVVHLCDVKGVYGDEDVNAVFGWKGYAEFAAAQQK